MVFQTYGIASKFYQIEYNSKGLSMDAQTVVRGSLNEKIAEATLMLLIPKG